MMTLSIRRTRELKFNAVDQHEISSVKKVTTLCIWSYSGAGLPAECRCFDVETQCQGLEPKDLALLNHDEMLQPVWVRKHNLKTNSVAQEILIIIKTEFSKMIAHLSPSNVLQTSIMICCSLRGTVNTRLG